MSVLHVVLVRWLEGLPADLGPLVDAMSEVPGVQDISYGTSISPENLEAGYEWMLAVTFVSAKARDGYLVHQLHLPVAALIGSGAEKVVVFDLPTPH